MENGDLEKLLEKVLAQKAEKSDVIVWLQGDRYDRGEKVVKLYQDNFAPIIVISGNDLLIGKGKRDDEENISISEMLLWLESKGVNKDNVLIDGQSMNTRGQATNVLSLAQKNGWRKIILVASPHHQLRAFMTFLKRTLEINWPGRIINQSADIGWLDIPGGRTKTCGEILKNEMLKIENYKDHIATAEECLAYLNL